MLHVGNVCGATGVEFQESSFSGSGESDKTVAYPGILFGGGGLTNSAEDRGQRERGSGGGSPLVSGSGGSCNLVQEISFHIVTFSQVLVL